MNVRYSVLAKAIGLLTLTAAACVAGKSASAQETVKIGMTSALSGPYNEYGEGAHRGIELAIEKWNANGWVNGKKVELAMLLDDQLVPDRAVQNMRRLLDDKELVAIIGPAGTGPTLAVIEMAQLDGRPYMNPIAQTPSITYPNGGKPRPNVFSFGLQNDVEMKMQTQYAISKGYKSIGLLHESTAAGVSAAQIVTGELKAEGKPPPVADESYNQKTQDMTAQIARLQRAGADIVIYTGLGADLAVARRTMARLNWLVPLLANNASLSPPYEEGAGDLVVGTLGSMIAAFGRDPLNPVAQEFTNAYKAKYTADRWWGSDPARPQLSMSLTVANAYDAGMVLFEGIRRSKSVDPKAIREAIEGINGYQGVNAQYTFSPEKHHGVTEKDLTIFTYVKADGKVKLQIARD